MGTIDAGYNWICTPVIYSYEPEHMRVSLHMCKSQVTLVCNAHQPLALTIITIQ